MPQKKRTASNPPVGLLKAVIEQSQSSVFAEAVKEWKMLNYFHEPEFKACVCCPADVSNFTVIMNVNNRNCMEICNSCAERYFDITLSSEIERVVRRIRSNSSWTINDEILDYMISKQIIDQYERESYRIIRSKRGLTTEERRLISRINWRLLMFTAFENKQAFDYINSTVAWSILKENRNHRNICTLRHHLLEGFISTNDIMKMRDISDLHYVATYNEIIQVEKGLVYTDPNSKDVMKNLTIKYGNYDEQQKQIRERRERREKLALKKLQYDEFGNELIDPSKMEDISDCTFYWDMNGRLAYY